MNKLRTFAESIHAKTDVVGFIMHYAGLVYALFMLAYFIINHQYEAMMPVLMLLIFMHLSWVNARQLANLQARLHFFYEMAEATEQYFKQVGVLPNAEKK